MVLQLRCPRCVVGEDKAKLAKNMVCTHCGASYTQLENGVYDLLPKHKSYADDPYFNYYEHEYADYYHDLGIPDAKAKAHQALALLTKQEARAVKSVVDIGCGPGIFLAELSRVLPRARLCVGTDLSSYILNIATEKTKGLTFVRADSHYLPFASESFDVATLIDVIEHVPEPQKMLAETRRVARKVLVRVPLERCLFYWIQSKLMRIDWKKTRGHINLYTKSSFIALMSQSGFKLVHGNVPQHGFPKEPFKNGVLWGLYSLLSWLSGFLPEALYRGLVITEFIGVFIPQETNL